MTGNFDFITFLLLHVIRIMVTCTFLEAGSFIVNQKSLQDIENPSGLQAKYWGGEC